MKLIKILITAIAVLSYQPIFCQTEYFVSLDPTTGLRSFINSIPGVRFISSGNATFDENNGRYIFIGTDSNFNNSLYSIDVNSGSIVSNPLFPVGLSPFDNIRELVFNNADSTLYGLLSINSSQTKYLVSIDPITGIHLVIDSLSGFQFTQSQTSIIDEQNNHFIFVGGNFQSGQRIKRLYTLDLATGSISTSPNFPNSTDPFDGIFNIKQDTLNNLIGMFDDHSSSTLSLVNIDRTTGVHSFIDTLSDFSTYMPFHSVYNKTTKVYSFIALDQNSDSRYFSYNATNGSLIYNPLYPILPDTNDNITELQIDNSTGMIYGLYWDNDIAVGLTKINNKRKISLFPNPVEGVLTIRLEEELIEEFDLFNSKGQLVATQKGMKQKELLFNTEGLKSGVYFVRVKSNEVLLTEKIVIQ